MMDLNQVALPRLVPALDAAFRPAVLWNRAFSAAVSKSGRARRCAIALERDSGQIARHELDLFPACEKDEWDQANAFYVERLVSACFGLRADGRSPLAAMIRWARCCKGPMDQGAAESLIESSWAVSMNRILLWKSWTMPMCLRLSKQRKRLAATLMAVASALTPAEAIARWQLLWMAKCCSVLKRCGIRK